MRCLCWQIYIALCSISFPLFTFDFSWVEKIPLARGNLEKTWLFHEIGCCYLELKRYTEAHNYGCRSLASADEIADEKWQLNASVLVAQSECKSYSFIYQFCISSLSQTWNYKRID